MITLVKPAPMEENSLIHFGLQGCVPQTEKLQKLLHERLLGVRVKYDEEDLTPLINTYISLAHDIIDIYCDIYN